MEMVTWQLRAMIDGRVPDCRHDGEAWGKEDAGDAGASLGFRGVLLYVKGDWDEFQKTFGMSSWASIYNPCPCCACPVDSLHVHFPGFLTEEGPPFEPRSSDAYEAACSKCEVEIDVDTE
eukprot:5882015-Pyramimonas_sp.AAC.1